MKKLQEILAALRVAKCPEDVFGVFNGSPESVRKKVQHCFRQLARQTHSDMYSDVKDKQLSAEAFSILDGFWKTAQEKIGQDIYGKKSAVPRPKDNGRVTFKTARYTYTILERIYSGGTCGIFQGIAQAKNGSAARVVIRVPHTHEDNDLMEREAQALGLISKKLKSLTADPQAKALGDKFSLRLPKFLESFKIQEPGNNEKRVINSFMKLPQLESGWFTLEEIRKQYPDGVESRIMTFIWNRILEGLTLAHAAGVVHGALTPNHIMVHAKEHHGNIIDWTASCRTGSIDKVPYMDKRYACFFPEEIALQNITPSPASDIYMSAWNMVYLLGGDPTEQAIPSHIEATIKDFLNRCVQPKKHRRPQSVDAVYKEFRQITKTLWGSRKFVELAMIAV